MSLEIGSSIVNLENSIEYAGWLGNEMKRKNCKYEVLISKYLHLFQLEEFKVIVMQSFLSDNTTNHLNQILLSILNKSTNLKLLYSELQQISSKKKNYMRIEDCYLTIMDSFDLNRASIRTEIMNSNEARIYNVDTIVFFIDELYNFCKGFLSNNRVGHDARPLVNDHEIDSNVPNLFCKRMPLNYVQGYFSGLITPNRKGGNYLTEDKVNLFIRRAFLGEAGIEKIEIDYGCGEKGYIISFFYKFYEMSKRTHDLRKKIRPKYIELLCNNFTGFEFKNVQQNFAKGA